MSVLRFCWRILYLTAATAFVILTAPISIPLLVLHWVVKSAAESGARTAMEKR